MSQYDSHSFRKRPYTHCQIVSTGEGMTSLHLKTNAENAWVTFLLVSCFPQQHWQIYPRSWHWVISPVPVLHIWKPCRKQGHIESMYVSDKSFCSLLLFIWHSSAPGSASPFTCVQASYPQIILTWCHLPVLNVSAPCSTQVFAVYKYMQTRV